MRVSSGKGFGEKRRSYRPTVEALEALRMLSAIAQTLPDLVAEQRVLGSAVPLGSDVSSAASDTWDAALGQTQLADILSGPTTSADPGALASGYSQLDRYLNRTWYRAGIPATLHEDSSQAVYLSLLQTLGRDRFDALVQEVGRVGIRDVLSRETPEGVDFFRAIDMVKKRAQRERTYQPLDSIAATATSAQEDLQVRMRGALQEAIDQSLNPREAALIHATLKGETPAEIASRWGIAPKTVSNEKTRAIQKLREALTAGLSD